MKSFNIITGEKGEGKTTLMLKIASEESSPVGFVSIHRGDDYFLLDLETGKETLLMSKKDIFPDRWKGWSVNTSLFDSVYERLSAVDSGKVFLDECGRMEIEGFGYDRTLRMLIGKKDTEVYITLRRPFIDAFVSHYSIVDYTLLEVERRAEG